MTRKVNTKRSKKLTSGLKLLSLFFLLTILFLCYVVNGKESIENSIVLIWILIGILLLEFYFLSLINRLFRSISRVEIKEEKIIFYVDRWIFVSEKDECVKVTKKFNKILFEFSNGLRLICITKVLFFIPINRNVINTI